ncbi:YcbB domain protein [compost metagenome]
MNMGMISEAGSRDIILMMELAAARDDNRTLPPLKELYEMAAAAYKTSPSEAAKEVKAIEQRLRRALSAGLINLASIGLTDYGNPKFEHYAPLYFDFEEVRLKMKEIELGRDSGKVKVNLKKFLQVLHLELLEGLGR